MYLMYLPQNKLNKLFENTNKFYITSKICDIIQTTMNLNNNYILRQNMKLIFLLCKL